MTGAEPAPETLCFYNLWRSEERRVGKECLIVGCWGGGGEREREEEEESPVGEGTQLSRTPSFTWWREQSQLRKRCVFITCDDGKVLKRGFIKYNTPSSDPLELNCTNIDNWIIGIPVLKTQ
jgi:hypothetical protein